MKKLITIFVILMITAACSNQPKDTYTVDEAIEQGDVVIEMENNKTKSTNLEKMIRFMKDTGEKKSAEVQIAVFQKDSSLKKKVEYNGNEYIITEDNGKKENVYTCEQVQDWSGQYLANDCVKDDKKVNGSVRLFEVSRYDQNKAMQKVKFENKDNE